MRVAGGGSASGIPVAGQAIQPGLELGRQSAEDPIELGASLTAYDKVYEGDDSDNENDGRRILEKYKAGSDNENPKRYRKYRLDDAV